jgi:hypothetical protein
MPVRLGKDTKGCFAQYGDLKKYYYECMDREAEKAAMAKAAKQGRAVKANK